MAGALAAAFTTPLDVLVTHTLTTHGTLNADGSQQSAPCLLPTRSPLHLPCTSPVSPLAECARPPESEP